MKKRVNAFFIQLNKDTLYRVMRRFTALLSFVVVMGVFWGLKLTGITMAGEAFCGFAEHRHDDSCVTMQLICGQSEVSGLVHDEEGTARQLICELTETLPHVHDENCLTELVCTEPEGEGHTHSNGCRVYVRNRKERGIPTAMAAVGQFRFVRCRSRKAMSMTKAALQMY